MLSRGGQREGKKTGISSWTPFGAPFTRWDVQQWPQQTKGAGPKGFRDLQWYRAMVVQSWYRSPLAVSWKRIKSWFIFRRCLLVSSQIRCYFIIRTIHYKLHVVLGARCICGSLYSWHYYCNIYLKNNKIAIFMNDPQHCVLKINSVSIVVQLLCVLKRKKIKLIIYPVLD